MKSMPTKIIGTGFQMLTAEARKELLRYEHTTLFLMILIAIFSIICGISMHILSGDFYDGIISAKIVFHERDFSALDNKTKAIFENDLSEVLYDSEYFDIQMNSANSTATNNRQPIADALNAIDDQQTSESQTKKPKVRKLTHVILSVNDVIHAEHLVAKKDDDTMTQKQASTSTTPKPWSKIVYNPAADQKFLESMSVDEQNTRWSHSGKAQLVYTFPFISEIVAIIWTSMCFIFHTSTKKIGGLPKPWHIVVPSIVVFTLMSVTNLVYTIVTNDVLKYLCSDLRANLTNINAVSCGQAISLLRPFIHEHSISVDGYLSLFRLSYISTMILWFLALLLMVLRYIFAIDFKLVDVDDIFDKHRIASEQIFKEVLLSRAEQKVLKRDRPKSEEDFQSAKTHLSEVATPLLEQQQQLQQMQLQQLPIKSPALA